MKRTLALVGSIIGTCFSAIFSIIMALAITIVLDLLAGLGSAGATAIVGIIFTILEIAIAIVALVLNIIVITKSTNIEKMKNKKPVIAAIVFNFLSAIIALYSLTSSFSFLNMLIGLGLIAAGILMIVDLINLKKVAQPSVQPQAENSEENAQ